MKKVLVTGGKGAMSMAVAERLKANSYEVDNLSLRSDAWKKVDFACYDTIVHVAGAVPNGKNTANDFYSVNYSLTAALAKKASLSGVKQFIYISSMAVYGVVPSLKKGEGCVGKDTPCKPISDYGKSKLMAEQAVLSFSNDKFHVAIIRVPSVYGVGKTDYLEQYKYSFGRLKRIPKAFIDRYKSIISIDNLCQLIYLIVENGSIGVFCPDDGRISAFELSSLIMQDKKPSKMLGFLVSLFKFNRRVVDYYGSVCYDDALTNIFDGEYRITHYGELISKIYEG